MHNNELSSLFSEKTNERYLCLVDKVLNSEELLSEHELSKINEIIEQSDKLILKINQIMLKFGQLINYDELKNNGAESEKVRRCFDEDYTLIIKIDETYKLNRTCKNYMFGYPMSFEEDSFTVKYLKFLESNMFQLNSNGDPFNDYRADLQNKDIELEILKLFAINTGFNSHKYWGYITSGGTEGNFWGMREGHARYPNGIIYISDKAHYSMGKFLSYAGDVNYKHRIIQSNDDDTINIDTLFREIKVNYAREKSPAVISVTWGTTCAGATDNVVSISNWLRENNIPHYIHLDSALYGGIPKNQLDAPLLPENISDYVDSISISMHKYIGLSKVNGILLSKGKMGNRLIEYTGQADATFIGSRDFNPFSAYQKSREVLERSHENKYRTNIEYFMVKAANAGIEFKRHGFGNIFIINKPSEMICSKYILATFDEYYNNTREEKAHIVILPFHNQEIIDELVTDIAKLNPRISI